MAEWLKATDCKFVSFTFIGSNPIFFVYFFLVVTKDQLALFFVSVKVNKRSLSEIHFLHKKFTFFLFLSFRSIFLLLKFFRWDFFKLVVFFIFDYL